MRRGGRPDLADRSASERQGHDRTDRRQGPDKIKAELNLPVASTR